MQQNNIMMYGMTMIQFSRSDFIIMHTIILLKYRILHRIQGQTQSTNSMKHVSSFYKSEPYNTRIINVENYRITTVIDLIESFGSTITEPTANTITWQVLISMKYGRNSSTDDNISANDCYDVHTVLSWTVQYFYK